MSATHRLKIAVEEKRLTLSAIAREASLAVSTVHDIIKGKIVDPRASTLDKLDNAAYHLLGPDPRVKSRT